MSLRKGTTIISGVSSGGTTDVQVNGSSITSNNVANLVTETAYNASTNKLATMVDAKEIFYVADNPDENHPFVFDGKKKGLYVFKPTNSFTYKLTDSSTIKVITATYVESIYFYEDFSYSSGTTSIPCYFYYYNINTFDQTITGKRLGREITISGETISISTNAWNLGDFLTAGSQIITGTKTFETIPRQSNTTAPTNNKEFTNKKYVDDSLSGKLDSSKVKTTTSTTSGDVYDVTYINSTLGDIETLLGGI